MLRNLIKVAFRNFLKERFYTFINVAGLAVGISVALLITIFIVNELSYDRFHSKADRTYRIISDLQMGSNRIIATSNFPPLAAALNSDMPEVQKAIRLLEQNGLILKVGDIGFNENNILFTEPGFFEIFDFDLLAGERSTALNNRNTVLLTPTLAWKYFQTAEWIDVVGRNILIGDGLYQVSGIVDEAPSNSHLRFSAIVNIESIPEGSDETWGSMNMSTYLLLHAGKEIEDVVNKIPDLIEKHNPGYKDLSSLGISITHIGQAITDVHLHSNVQGEFEPNGSVATLYIFGTVALVVLLLACVNFVNLTTARSANRAKEVGVRKVLGSTASTLAWQFTLESILVVAIAALISLGIVELLRLPFSELIGRTLSYEFLLQPLNMLLLLAFTVMLGILAGTYPSLFLANLKPSVILKGKVRSGFRSSRLRNSLVSIQFAISIALITCTLVVQRQLNFMREKKLGFDKENVLVIRNGDRLQSHESFTNSLKRLASVKEVGSSEFKPIDDYDGTVALTEEDKENRRLINTCKVDFDYLNTLRFEFVAGRNFSRDHVTDSSTTILNESAAAYLFEGDAIGKKIFLGNEDNKAQKRTVIGIVKDFNFQSLKNEIKPLVFKLSPNNEFIHVRLNPGNFVESIASIKTLWEQNADVSFDYTFLDESYNNLFKEESRMGSIFSLFTILALLIACLGLLGLATYMSEQRSKELSVRKVMGATLSQIVVLLSKDFVRLIIIASILAFPVAYYAMDKWLAGYVYRAPLSWTLFLVSGLSVLVVALVAVSYQSIKAALVNPVDSLRNE